MQKIVNCRCHCYFELNDNQWKEIFETFYAMSDHEMQNTYLRGCITKKQLKIFVDVHEQLIP